MTTMIRIRPETRRKVDAVAAIKRWTITEATDAAYDALIEKEQLNIERAIGVPETAPVQGNGGDMEGVTDRKAAGLSQPLPPDGDVAKAQ